MILDDVWAVVAASTNVPLSLSANSGEQTPLPLGTNFRGDRFLDDKTSLCEDTFA
jgi:hypothetical protein